MTTDSIEEAGLVHGLSNLNLLDAQSNSAAQVNNGDTIQSRAAPALAGIDQVLETLREVG